MQFKSNFESCIIYESVKNIINKDFEKNKLMSIDEIKKFQFDVQKITDDYINNIDKIFQKKH